MKKVFLFAAIAALFAGCSSKDELVKDDSTQQPQLEKGAIGFDVYTQKATTRAGWTGSVTTNGLKGVNGSGTALTGHDLELSEAGFGVFGYYTDNNEYEQRSVPNFMYNQQVKWDGSNFSYNPVVYWPNEYGDKAISDDSDKLTFFAYAPYVKVVPSSGKVDGAATNKTLEQWGITGMTKNTTQGDPILKYIGSFDNTKSVDLCWGVADNGDGAVWNTTQTGNPQTEIKNGMPWIDLERPAGVDQKVRFTFKHATAQMRVSIDADIDVDGRGHTTSLTKKTRIWVRQITFKGFTMKGSLNLDNDDPSTPKWLDYNGQNELVAEDVVIYDGRKDGKEGVAGAVATNEKTLGLNPALIQDGVYAPGEGSDSKKGIYDETKDVVVYGVDASGNQKSSAEWARPGVTNTTVNLFKYNNTDNTSQTSEITAGEFFHVIPVNDNFEVEIVYDVETVDQNLAQSLSDGAAKGSSIENRISKTISFGSETKLQSGHSYTLALHLGMNSVKFDAAVTDWIDEAAQDVDLPLNTPAFAVSGTPYTVTLPYTGPYNFAITGLDGGESITTDPATNTAIPVTTNYANWSVTKANANTSGVAIQTVTTAVNPLTTDRTTTIKWTGNQSNKAVTMNFKQKAHPLFMAITKMWNTSTGGNITLTRYDDESHSSSNHWIQTDNSTFNEAGWRAASTGSPSVASDLKVWRNGTLLTSGVTLGDTGTGATNTITLTDKLNPGDVIKVELTTGDAPTETVTARYDGMYFVSPSATIQYKESYTLPEVKNANGDVTYESKNTGIATVNSSGVITTVAPGEVIIEAKDVSENKAEFTLTVTKQNVLLNGFANASETKSLSQLAGLDIVKNWSSVSVIGVIDGTTVSDVSGITWDITSATKEGVEGDFTNLFKIEGNRLRISSSFDTSAPGSAGNYTINVTGSYAGNDYYKETTKPVVITLEVTNP